MNVLENVPLHERTDVAEALKNLRESLGTFGCTETAVILGPAAEPKITSLTVENQIGSGSELALGYDGKARMLWLAPTLTPRADWNTNTFVKPGTSDNGAVVVEGGVDEGLQMTIAANHPVARFLGLVETLVAPDQLTIKLLGDSNKWNLDDAPDVNIKDDKSLVVSGIGKGNAKMAIALMSSKHIGKTVFNDAHWTAGQKQSLEVNFKA